MLEFVKKYGDTEDIYGLSEQELLGEMREIDLCSKEAMEIKDWGDDEVVVSMTCIKKKHLQIKVLKC